MNAVYELKNGMYLELFLGMDILKGKPNRKKISAIALDKRKGRIPFEEFELSLEKDENGFYVIYIGEKIYLDEFISMDIEDLNEKLEFDSDGITSDEILAFLHKNSDSVAFLCPLISKDKKYEDEVLCILETSQIPKEDISYEVHLTPKDENDALEYMDNVYYFSDFARKIKNKSIKVVRDNSFRNNGIQRTYRNETDR